MTTYEIEKTKWAVNHKLNVNYMRSEKHLCPLLDKFSPNLVLCHSQRDVMGIKYEHWFVKDKESDWKIEFSGTNGNFHVNVDCNPIGEGYNIAQDFSMTLDVKKRMKQVCGATNYSLALRNCEHVARYIHAGVWVSFQMVNPDSFIRKKMVKDLAARIKFPEELKPPDESFQVIFKDLTDFVHFGSKIDALSERDEKGYNILVIGPTGSGKSTIINHLYNQKVCCTVSGVKPGTRDVHYTQGQFSFLIKNDKGKSVKKMRTVNLIDTIGLCDNMLENHEVNSFVKASLKINLLHLDKILVVCCERITPQHTEAIKMLLGVLQFDKFKNRFAFIYNKCDDLTEEERSENVEKMCELLNSNSEGDGNKQPDKLAIGFPRRVTDMTEVMRIDMENLKSVALTPIESKIMLLQKKSCLIM